MADAKMPAAKPIEVRVWKVGRAVEGTGLENRQGRKFLVSSNLTPSAKFASNRAQEDDAVLGEARQGVAPGREGHPL